MKKTVPKLRKKSDLSETAVGERRHFVVGGRHLHQDLTTVDLFPFGRQDNGPVVGLALVVEATNQEPLPFVAQQLYGLSGKTQNDRYEYFGPKKACMYKPYF